MTRQSKNARNIARRKAITAMHKNGEKGPARTTPKHGKRVTYRTNPATQKALAEILKGTAPKEKTSGREILRKAGKASIVNPDED
jgi:hypothetical protein